MKFKILLVSSGQPSLNPRLVKEADTLSAAGYHVTVFYAYWNSWGTELDKELLKSKTWTAIRVGGDPEHQLFTYFISRLLFKFAHRFTEMTGSTVFSNWAISRSTPYLIRHATKHRADLYIGHNLGALPAVIAAAKKHTALCGFDAEDFHRNEVSDDHLNPDVKLKSYIEDKYLSGVNYFSASSRQIADAYQRLYPWLRPVVLCNVFPNTKNISLKANRNDPLKLFWFSQTIGSNRGLESLISLLDEMPGDFELHLLGDLNPQFKKVLSIAKTKIHLHAPIPPDDLPFFASQFDIGLALEPGFSINNNLALSNKIFTYLQAGLAIVASNTSAQQYLLNEYPQIGKLFNKNDRRSLASVLQYYHINRDELVSTRQASLNLALDTLNWEHESRKLLTVIKTLLPD